MPSLDQFQGCLLGLALGDALGAPHEGGFLEKLLWRVLGSTRDGVRRWTDDTQVSVDLVESYLAQGCFDPDALARRFAESYRWTRGYGPGTARILKRIKAGGDWRVVNRSVYPQGSLGNGAAMRAPILGLIHADEPHRLPASVQLTGSITHAHPAGLEGALVIAQVNLLVAKGLSAVDSCKAAAGVCTLPPFQARMALALEWLDPDRDISPERVAKELGHGIAAQDSCVTALYVGLRFIRQPFEAMHGFAVAVGGDVDTIAAMAGAIWGTANGASRLPVALLEKLEGRERLAKLGEALHQAFHGQNGPDSDQTWAPGMPSNRIPKS